jgi:hypothetical protein
LLPRFTAAKAKRVLAPPSKPPADTPNPQIIPPLDSGIAAAIEANLELWDLSGVDLARAASDGRLTDPLEAVADAYFSRLSKRLVFGSPQENGAAAPVVYTPLVRLAPVGPRVLQC